ncbi:MAG: hypothetical protein H7Z17_14660 [Fuerstia sp.]|nr:hypothetical protein [Fuerstiella sp.]
MNARVFLLALVTAAFMAIWDADHPVAGRTAAAQSKMRDAAAAYTNAAAHSVPSVAAEQPQMRTVETAANDSASAAGTSEALIPLPKNLQPGTWQAISRDGDTFRITIERRDSFASSTATVALPSEDSEKRFCVITAPDGIRWCFIKEHPKTAAQTGTDHR